MISEAAVELVMHFHGFSSAAYAGPDHVSRGGSWPWLSIGYGHSGEEVTEGQMVTVREAQDLLARDLANVEALVDTLFAELPPQERDALCCLAYAIGPSHFKGSRLVQLLKAGMIGECNCSPSLGAEKVLETATDGMRAWLSIVLVDDSMLDQRAADQRLAEVELFITGSWSLPEADRVARGLTVEPARQEALHPGMRSEIISDLHAALDAVGFPVTCGDAYTWVTEQAVREFQSAKGLPATGIYDQATARALAEAIQQ